MVDLLIGTDKLRKQHKTHPFPHLWLQQACSDNYGEHIILLLFILWFPFFPTVEPAWAELVVGKTLIVEMNKPGEQPNTLPLLQPPGQGPGTMISVIYLILFFIWWYPSFPML